MCWAAKDEWDDEISPIVEQLESLAEQFSINIPLAVGSHRDC